MAGKTITEKILARVAGRGEVSAGDDVHARPDFVLAYDFPGYTNVFQQTMLDEFGTERPPAPERFGIFLDHLISDPTPVEEALHRATRAWCEDTGMELIEGRGIGHQVATEMGFATPGSFVVHFDGHVSQLGAFGALAIGLRRNILEAFVRERISLRVPESVKVELTGTLRPGVMARDVLHHLVRELGPASCGQQVLELSGPALACFSAEGLQTMTGLAMFLGALTAIVEPDEARRAYMLPRARLPLAPEFSDRDASYSAIHRIDISAFQPVVVAPPSPAKTRALVDFLGVPVTHGYIGSCAGGRMEDLRAAAMVLEGRKVAPGFQLSIVPSSVVIERQAAAEGLLARLSQSGASILKPGCDMCYGRIGGMAAGGRAVSTGTLNVRGRMGSIESEIFLCNAAVVAAASLTGAIADPRPYLLAAREPACAI